MPFVAQSLRRRIVMVESSAGTKSQRVLVVGLFPRLDMVKRVELSLATNRRALVQNLGTGVRDVGTRPLNSFVFYALIIDPRKLRRQSCKLIPSFGRLRFAPIVSELFC